MPGGRKNPANYSGETGRYRPTLDPDWHHSHVPTGEIRQCQAPHCGEAWPVTCHAGRRRYCPACARARRRARDRRAKAFARARQASQMSDARDYIASFGMPFDEAIELISSGVSRSELIEILYEFSEDEEFVSA